jgi:hypothetical protein
MGTLAKIGDRTKMTHRGRANSRPNGHNSVPDGRTSALNEANVAPEVVKIMYWNIYHNFTLGVS